MVSMMLQVASNLYSRCGFKEESVVDCLDSNAALGGDGMAQGQQLGSHLWTCALW